MIAIGNIEKGKLKNVIENVFDLLKNNGLFLGKSLYSFNKLNYSRSDIMLILSNYSKNKDDFNLYQYTMYPLSIFAYDENSYLIDFQNIYDIIQEYCQTKENSEDFDIYLRGNTSFKDKLNISFYIYPCKEFLEICDNFFKLTDIRYGSDIYSKYFPMYILKKQNNSEKRNLKNAIHNVFYGIESYVRKIYSSDNNFSDWNIGITSEYFLLKLINLYHNIRKTDLESQIVKKVKKNVISAIEISLNEELNCYISNYNDDYIERETLKKTKEKNDISENLSVNYVLGLLSYITTKVTIQKNDAFKVVKNKLFKLLKNDLWEPVDSPWVSARICLLLKESVKYLPANQKNKLYKVIHYIIYQFDSKKLCWHCNENLGSETDTTALCLETLLEYFYIIDDNDDKIQIKNIFKKIIEHYIFDNNIYETITTYYVSVEMVNNLKQSESKWHRETSDRIEFLTVLLRILHGFYNKLHEEEENLLIYFINDFWNHFNLADISMLTELEISTIPQILYSCAKAVSIFIDIDKNKTTTEF